MRKVFNSVGLEILKKLLERIKLPKNIVSFILSLYEKRKIKVITNFSLTKEFETKDGLDQVKLYHHWPGTYSIILCYAQFKKQKT